MSFVSGKSGYVFITDGVSGLETDWAFKKWKKKNRTKPLPRNVFTARGKDQWIAGFQGCDITLEGPYDTDNPIPLEDGLTYSMYFGITADGPIEFGPVSVFVESIEMDNDAEDGPMWVVSGMSNGDFSSEVPQAG